MKTPLYFKYFNPSKIGELRDGEFNKQSNNVKESFKSHWLKYTNKSRKQIIEESYERN